MKLQEQPLLVPTTTGERFVFGYYLPGTDKLMFVHRQRDKTWAITHVPTGRRMLWVLTRDEALEYGKSFYDAARREGLPINSIDIGTLASWPQAIMRHVPRFADPSGGQAA